MRPLVGRGEDLGELLAALESVRQGRMATIFLSGDAGVGKTRLVQELVGRAEGTGATVLLGAATDIAESPPFWPVASALRAALRSPRGDHVRRLLEPWSDQLDELLALGPALPAPLARVQTLELLHRVVLRLALESVLVVVVEDVQWADRSTLDLIAYLVANLADERLLLVGTCRTEPGVESSTHPARTVIRELARHRQVRTIEVPPLRRDAVAELVAAAEPGRPDLVELVWMRSAGNAFIAEETLRAAVDGDPTGLPTTLRELVLSRLDRLSAPALRTVRAVALADGPLPHRLLEAVLDGEPWLLDALRESVDAGVVVVDAAADGYRLRHGLMTDVVAGELLPGERMDLHRRYATALESEWARELPGRAARLAHHWYGAGDRLRAAVAAVAAAEAADRVRGYAEAHRHWLRAAQLAGEVAAPPVPRVTCLERAAEAAHLAGDADQAVALLAERLDLLDPPDDPGAPHIEAALLHACTGQYLVAAGRGAEAAEAFGRATTALPADGAERERADVLGGHASALWTAGDYAAAHETAGRALALARRIGLAVQEARALATLGFGLAYLQDPVAGEAALRESIAVAERAGEPLEIARAHRSLAELLSGPLNDLDRGIAIARAGAARARELGLARSAGAGLLAVAANGLFRIGRWDEADDTIAEAWELAPAGAEALELRLARARLHIGRGRFGPAEDDLEAVGALSVATLGPRYRLPLLTLWAGLAMWEERPDHALDHVAAGLDVVERGSDDVWLVAPLLWHGARARAELTRLGLRRPDDGTDARLRRHAAALARVAAASVPAVRDVVLGFLDMAAAEDGRAAGRSDPQAWERVAETWRERRQPYPAAYAHLRRAEALLATRASSTAAAESLRRAGQIARELGATPFLAEIADLADRARVRIDEPEPAAEPARPDVPDDELAALTARELEVLTELACGHTNREIAQRLFISEKTVGVHISRIYAKLDVHSRVQASAVLMRARPQLGRGQRS
ncbi:putative ATPase [Pseudonocardia cypriaca]|uniref:Putative ATPase n=1 Tax=Pseudonocardia cypriaca TaxID=882449 RepID=A0A543GDZ8_9PSEU|nr:putative ATPase [Pseudonocardia cypriaca]